MQWLVFHLGILCFLATLVDIEGFPNGAPLAACGDMVPQHGHEPQNTTTPYKLMVEAGQDSSTYKVTVSAPDSGHFTDFKGFFIHATLNDEVVGEFTMIDSSTTHYRPCPEDTSPNNGITHLNNLKKTSVEATFSYSGNIHDITMRASVVNVEQTFWVGLTA